MPSQSGDDNHPNGADMVKKHNDLVDQVALLIDSINGLTQNLDTQSTATSEQATLIQAVQESLIVWQIPNYGKANQS